MNEPLKDQAASLLWEIKTTAARAVTLEAAMTAEIEAVKARYTEIGKCRERLAVLDAEIKKLMKARDKGLFEGKDKVKLPSGFLIRAEEERVSIPRKALEIIKARGWKEAIRVAESIKRDVVATWPADRLKAIGAKKKPEVKYGYEVQR